MTAKKRLNKSKEQKRIQDEWDWGNSGGGKPPSGPVGSAANKPTAKKQTATKKPTAKKPKSKDFPTYDKNSKSATSFRSATAAAKKAGKKTFTWEGRKYSTKEK